jgi:phosphatidate cytidylyltransferase
VVRVATAAIGIPVVLFITYVGGWPFAITIGAVTLAATVEFYMMMRAGSYRPALHLGLPAAVALAVWPFVTARPAQAWIAILVLVVSVAGGWYLLPANYRGGLGGWLSTVAGAAYIGLFLGHLSLLRQVHDGAWWVVASFLMTWGYDSGAYFAGSYLGRHPFMQHVSSRKTLEGVAGGLIVSTIVALILAPTVGVVAWKALLLGLGAGMACQTGDLVESMLKRHAGVKDSGRIIPGHGGLLDRIDGLLFAGVLTYYVAALLGYAP